MDKEIRKIKQGDKGVYAEQGNITINYGDKKIKKILGTPPFFPEIFLGRDEDLTAIYKKLFKEESLLLLVNGEGGIGKTTLAAKYWQKYHEEYKHLAWVFAQKSILDALLTLALPLKVQFPEDISAEQMLEFLLMEMANLDKPSLLVIDNANDIRDLEKYYLALRSVPNFHLILTSRITEFEQAKSYQIKPLEEADAIRLFKKHYPKHQDSEDELLKGIRKAVGGNTLVLELLAKNLNALNSDEIFYSLDDLLKDLQKLGILQLSQSEKVKIAKKGNSFSLKKAKPEDIIKALYDEVEMVKPLTDFEQNLLCNLSVLPAENMPYALLKDLLLPQDSKQFSKALTDLAQRGWIEKEITEQLSFYKISPVIQEITRHKNKNDLLIHCENLISSLIKKLKYQPGIGHLLNVSYEEASFYSRYADNVTNSIKKADNNLAILCERIGNYYQTTGKLDKALTNYEKDLKLIKELYEDNPKNVEFKNGLAISYEKLGDTHAALGNLEKARTNYEKYSELTKELHNDYPKNVKFKNGLAISYEKLGDTHDSLNNLEKARIFFEQYNKLEKELYDANPQNVEFKNRLAISYEKLNNAHNYLGNLEEVLTLFEQSNQSKKKHYNAYPQNVEFKSELAVSYSNLGSTHASLGNLKKALTFFEYHNRLQKELYEDYPKNVSFKNGLALSYQFLGWFFEKELNNKIKAIAYYQLSKALLVELVSSCPIYVVFKRKLDWVNERLSEE